MRRWRWAAVTALVLAPGALDAATHDGRSVDDRWYEGQAVSTTYGAYKCQMKFHGDRVFFRLTGTGLEIVGVLDDEEIVDEHDILVHDPKRGGDWTLDCYNLGHD